MKGLPPKWPMVELHTHLEGAITPEDAWSSAAELGMKLPWSSLRELDAAISLPDRCCSLKEWAPIFDARRGLFSSPELITAMTRKLLARYRGLGCRHVELRFNPTFIARLAGVPEDEVVQAVAAALEGLQDMSAGLIVLATRHRGPEEAIQAAEAAARNRGRGVVAFDLAGQEIGNPAQNYVEAFDIARRAGLRLTAHAGEESGPESIRAALDVLGAERIGHGLSLEQDPGLLAEVARRQVALEMCPISNCRTGVTASVAAHPVIRYLRAGVRVTLNSDDPGLFGTTLRDDWERVEQELAPSADERRSLVWNSVEAAFLPDAERAVLRARIEQDLAAVAMPP
ncbi:MAG TPA: adenosine deaminase [Ramlibacter sp.]|nr:adenosine deaminase [Ramlibacter sp.]